MRRVASDSDGVLMKCDHSRYWETENVCAVCYMLHRAGTPSNPAPTTSVLDLLSCKWRHEPTGETVECPTCGGGKVKLKTFKCDVFERCTIDREVEGIAMCLGCAARVPEDKE